MTTRIRNITVDCVDARALAGFWAELLGWNVYYDDDPEVYVAPTFPYTDRPGMLFIPVPEGKTAKNRMHVDVQPTDLTRDEEVERLLELGASIVEDHREKDGSGWVWMADPEGNDFCVERNANERAAARSRQYRVTSDS